jgi:hypothetical protein
MRVKDYLLQIYLSPTESAHIIYVYTYSSFYSCLKTSVVDRHCFDTNLDPTSHFEVDPDPNPNLGFTHVRKSDFILLLFIAVPIFIV